MNFSNIFFLALSYIHVYIFSCVYNFRSILIFYSIEFECASKPFCNISNFFHQNKKKMDQRSIWYYINDWNSSTFPVEYILNQNIPVLPTYLYLPIAIHLTSFFLWTIRQIWWLWFDEEFIYWEFQRSIPITHIQLYIIQVLTMLLKFHRKFQYKAMTNPKCV